MITKIVKNAHIGKGDIAKFTKYLFSLQHEQEEITERLGCWDCEMSMTFDTLEEAPDPKLALAFADEVMSFNDQMKQGRKLTKKSRHAVMGCTSFHPDDKKTPEECLSIVKEATEKAIPGKRPRLYVCHIDRDHIHVHFVIGGVDTAGKYYNPPEDGMFRSFERQNELAELKYDLKRVDQRQSEAIDDPTRAVWVSAPKSVDVQQADRTGVATPDLILRAKLAAAFENNKGNFDGFLDDMAMSGVRVMPTMSKDPEGKAKCSGLSFALAGSPVEHGVKASALGKKYGWKNLSGELNYVQNQHSERLSELRNALTNPENTGSHSLTSGLDSQSSHTGLTSGDSLTSGKHDQPSLGAVEQNTRADRPNHAGHEDLATGNGQASSHSDQPSIATTRPATPAGEPSRERSGSHRDATSSGLHAGDTGHDAHTGSTDRSTDADLSKGHGRVAGQNDQGYGEDDQGQRGTTHRDGESIRGGDDQTGHMAREVKNGGVDDVANVRVVHVVQLPDLGSDAKAVRELGATHPMAHRSSQILRETPTRRKLRTAWKEQHAALKGENYSVNIVDRVGNGSHPLQAPGGSHINTAEDVENSLGYLANQNARGRDIYITPLYAEHHSILVDDLTTAKLAELKADGFTPNLIQQSSKDNMQAVFVIPKHPAGGDISKNAANRLTNFLNKKFGDPKLNGCDHTFRMAGFQNKKPQRNNEITTVISTAFNTCAKAVAGFRKALEMNATAQAIEMDKRATLAQQAIAKAFTSFGRHWKKHAALWNGKGQLDASAVDFNAAVDTFKEAGPIRAKEIVYDVEADMKAKVKADGRKHADDYALKTTKKALGRAIGDGGEGNDQTPQGTSKTRKTADVVAEIKPIQGGIEI